MMSPFMMYFLACFTSTVLWFLTAFGVIATIAGLLTVWIDDGRITRSHRRLCWQAVAWGVSALIISIPSLRVLYVFWGRW